MKRLFVIVALATSLAGCNAYYDKNLAAGVAQVTNAAQKAEVAAKEGIKQVCTNYPIAHAIFTALTWTGKIPENYVQAEVEAANYLAAVCASPPDNASEVYNSVKLALATIVKIKDQWKSKA